MNRGGIEKKQGKELRERTNEVSLTQPPACHCKARQALPNGHSEKRKRRGILRFLAAARNDIAKGFFNQPTQTRPATLFKAAGQKRKGNTLVKQYLA